MIVTTELGTRYKIDVAAKTWERLSKTDKSGHLRTESGSITNIDGPVVGQRMVILAPPLNPESAVRVISTSPVALVEFPENGREGVCQRE